MIYVNDRECEYNLILMTDTHIMTSVNSYLLLSDTSFSTCTLVASDGWIYKDTP